MIDIIKYISTLDIKIWEAEKYFIHRLLGDVE